MKGYSSRNQGGWKHSEETKAKLRLKRVSQVITEETRQKMRLAHLGKKHTPQELIKMSERQIGKVVSDITRNKQSLWQMGTRNNRWKGGITPFRRKLRNLGKYVQWRLDVIARDGGCTVCGSIEQIEVDHYPMTLKDLLFKYHITTVERALNCKALWNVDNGRVLCRIHHEEHTYGSKTLILSH